MGVGSFRLRRMQRDTLADKVESALLASEPVSTVAVADPVPAPPPPQAQQHNKHQHRR
jgi:hypothetical protein